ncbi:unnamed protein product [Caenorhabditis nigoni]
MNRLGYGVYLEKRLYRQLGETGGCPDSQVIHAMDEIPLELHLNVKLDKHTILDLADEAGKQTMAYVITKCMATGEKVHSFALTMRRLDIDYPVHGPPGSQCKEYKIPYPDGLCGWKYGGGDIDQTD